MTNQDDDLTQEEADFFAVGLIAWLRDLGAETRRQMAAQDEAAA